jgi:SAM-dependent methyltransferase
MATDYDRIAEEYKRAKQQPWRFYIERYTLFRLIGDLVGKSVLDLACGEGYYTRALRHKGAAQVVGIDLSAGMIELAQKEEARKPLGIEYRVQDARDVERTEAFDLVVAAYLLNYAQTREDLLAMTQAVARSLKPGGRFVTVNNNPEQPPEQFALGRPYGFVKSMAGELREGTPITFTIFLDSGPIDITNYHLSVATHEWAFRSAGLHDVRWHGPEVSPEGVSAFGAEHWADFLASPPVTFIECVRPRTSPPPNCPA